MARKFLYFMIVLILLVIAGGFAFRFYQIDLMKAALIPSERFEGGAVTPEQAYEAGHVVRAARHCQQPTLWTPANFTRQKPPAAVFFIHPTSYIDRTHWNAPRRSRQTRSPVFLRGQFGFNVLARSGPRYRRATFGAFLTSREKRRSTRFRLS